MRSLLIVSPFLLALAVGLAAAEPAPAKPLAPPPTSKPRSAGDAPEVELAEAVVRSRAYASKNHVDLSRQYLQSVSFDFVKRCWKVVWQTPKVKGGVTEFIVPEGGAISVDYGE